MRTSAFKINAISLALALLCIVGCALAEESYFPIQTKPGEPGLSAFEAKWYGESLKRMKEPRLPEAARDSNAVIYRLMILPTWGNPIVVRVEKHDRTYSLAARRLDGQGGYNPGKLVEKKDAQLSETDSAALEMLIAQLKFFDMPTDDRTRGCDGDEWIIEGVSGGKYHVVDRWCASSEGTRKRGLMAFMGLCRFLIDKSTLSVRPTNKSEKLI
jgi:hypothetical protein